MYAWLRTRRWCDRFSIAAPPRRSRAHDPPAACWCFRLAVQGVSDDRDKLPPVEGRYLIRLLIDADGGPARSFDVYLDWNGDPNLNADQVLRSALDHLALLERRQRAAR